MEYATDDAPNAKRKLKEKDKMDRSCQVSIAKTNRRNALQSPPDGCCLSMETSSLFFSFFLSLLYSKTGESIDIRGGARDKEADQLDRIEIR